ncbi:MAG: alpha-glucan family phosphorylase [Deltaproteobacteria bacterium]|nr:alpha-glucan family phosphorylase [Deltaproteobacteria bacterium]MDQ3299841.1 alpha-glucan family phosphorylase [Myxococcota bacterium]
MSSCPRVAYFCMEYGLDPTFPIYAGGLGILAGDHMKSVGDLHAPVTGVGLFWDEGYTRQVVGAGHEIEDQYPKTPRDAMHRVDVRVEVTVRGKRIPLVAWKVDRFITSTLYLLEPEREEDRWITQRLYGGGAEDRIAQEIVLGVGGVRLLAALGVELDLYHFNEGHAVFAGLELLRQTMFGGTTLVERIARLRPHVVFTTHTPVPAGNEVHDLALLRKMDADLSFTDKELEVIGGDPFSMTVAGLRLARLANGVAELHGETARTMWKDVDGAAPIIAITNGVHVPTWQDARIRAALVSEKPRETQDAELWTAHQAMKGELIAEIARRTNVTLAADKLLIGFARRAATYKRADLILNDERALKRLFDRGVQLVYAGKAHPRDLQGKALIGKVVDASKKHPGNVVFLENYDMRLGAMLTRGTDVWLNNPRRPLEASGTSGMKAAMNGVPNLSILDGWWPEGCEHGITGWKIGDPDPADDAFDEKDIARVDKRDREILHQVIDRDVLPAYGERTRWVAIMRGSIAMSQWRFSSDRMIEDYINKVYSGTSRQL